MIPEFFAEQIKPSGMFGIFFYANTKSSAIACGKLQIIYFNTLVYNALVKIYAAFFYGQIYYTTVFCAFRIPPIRGEFSVSVAKIAGATPNT